MQADIQGRRRSEPEPAPRAPLSSDGARLPTVLNRKSIRAEKRRRALLANMMVLGSSVAVVAVCALCYALLSR